MAESRSSKIDVLTEDRGQYGVVAVLGDLDSTTAWKLDEALSSVEAGEAMAIVLDLSRLDFMDSTGLHLITEAEQRATKCGRRFAVVRGKDPVQRVFEVTGLDLHLEFVDDVDSFTNV